MTAIEKARKVPRQQRARTTVDYILEAATQVLEATGEAGFNTNAVAERAGVSIGALYRYFPDKQAILQALAQRETETHRRAVMAVVEGGTPGVARDRAMIRAFVQAFAGRSRARRIAMSSLLATADHGALASRFAAAETGLTDAEGRPLTPVQAFVLSRAVQGAMRRPFWKGPTFCSAQSSRTSWCGSAGPIWAIRPQGPPEVEMALSNPTDPTHLADPTKARRPARLDLERDHPLHLGLGPGSCSRS